MKMLATLLTALALSAGGAFAACSGMSAEKPVPQTTVDTSPIVLPPQTGS